MAVFLPVAFMGGIVGPLPEELRPDHGLRHRASRCSSASRSRRCWPRAGSSRAPAADGGGAPQGRCSSASSTSSTGRIERGYMALLALGRCGTAGSWWSPRVLALASLRAAAAGAVPKGFLPDNDEAQFEVNVRAPEGTSLERDARSSPSASPARSARCPACDCTLTTIGDDDQRDAEPRQHLRQAAPTREQRARVAARAHGPRAPRDRWPSSRPTLRVDVSQVPVIRRRRPTATVQYDADRARSRRSSSEYARPDRRRRSKKVPGAVDVDTIAASSASPSWRCRSTARRPPTSASHVADVAEHAAAARRRRSRSRPTTRAASSTTCACAPSAQYRADAEGLAPADRALDAGSAPCRSPTS